MIVGLALAFARHRRAARSGAHTIRCFLESQKLRLALDRDAGSEPGDRSDRRSCSSSRDRSAHTETDSCPRPCRRGRRARPVCRPPRDWRRVIFRPHRDDFVSEADLAVYSSSVRACTASARDVVPGSAVLSTIRTRTPSRVSHKRQHEARRSRANDENVRCRESTPFRDSGYRDGSEQPSSMGFPVRIFQLDLSAAGADFHLVAKCSPAFFQRRSIAGRLCTRRTTRVQPPGWCAGRPSGIGRDPDAPGPLSRVDRRVPE